MKSKLDEKQTSKDEKLTSLSISSPKHCRLRTPHSSNLHSWCGMVWYRILRVDYGRRKFVASLCLFMLVGGGGGGGFSFLPEQGQYSLHYTTQNSIENTNMMLDGKACKHRKLFLKICAECILRKVLLVKGKTTDLVLTDYDWLHERNGLWEGSEILLWLGHVFIGS